MTTNLRSNLMEHHIDIPSNDDNNGKFKDKNVGQVPGSDYALGDYASDANARLCYAGGTLGRVSVMAFLAGISRWFKGRGSFDVGCPIVLGAIGVGISALSIAVSAKVKSAAQKKKISALTGGAMVVAAIIGSYLSLVE